MTKLVSVLAVLCMGGILNTAAQDVRADIVRLLEVAENIDENVEGLEEKLDDVADEVDDVGDEIDNLEDEIEDFGEGVEDVETAMEAVRAEVVNLQQEVKATRENLEAKINDLEQNMKNEMRQIQQDGSTCAVSDTEEVKDELASLREDIQEVKNQLTSVKQVVLNVHNRDLTTSCRQLHPTSPSGYYWLTGVSERVYCDMDRQSCGCGNPWGWMRVAHIDMTNPDQQCPDGFRLRAGTSPRMCSMIGENVCTSVTFPTHGVEYSRVCGRVKAYQYASTDGFWPYYRDRSITIDGQYVDGFSITHGQNPRKHIWTFAAALDEGRSTSAVCFCTNTGIPYTGVVPPFVGNDYFCETGAGRHWERRLFTEDPLWDGVGCRSSSTCCQFNSPPWFCKELPQPTTDDIEVRACMLTGSSKEETPFELIEIYIQ